MTKELRKNGEGATDETARDFGDAVSRKDGVSDRWVTVLG